MMKTEALIEALKPLIGKRIWTQSGANYVCGAVLEIPPEERMNGPRYDVILEHARIAWGGITIPSIGVTGVICDKGGCDVHTINGIVRVNMAEVAHE
jgi:hypothetical protein